MDEASVSTAQATAAAPEAARTKKSNLYTRTGDDGTSSLYTGERRSKQDPTFKMLGNIDELNSGLGVARTFCAEDENGLEEILVELQCCLTELMSHIATPPREDGESDEDQMPQIAFDADGSKIAELEQLIDGMDTQLPALTCFILPSGGRSSTSLHHARSICRRAERSLYQPLADGAISTNASKFLNRCSDLLFAMGRFAAAKVGATEQPFKSSKDKDRGFGGLPRLEATQPR